MLGRGKGELTVQLLFKLTTNQLHPDRKLDRAPYELGVGVLIDDRMRLDLLRGIGIAQRRQRFFVFD